METLTHRWWTTFPTLNITVSNLSDTRKGWGGVEIFLLFCRSSVKKIFCSKAWRRIIPFGPSPTSVTKGGRRNILFGLPTFRRKSQPSTFHTSGKEEKVIYHDTWPYVVWRVKIRKMNKISSASNYYIWSVWHQWFEGRASKYSCLYALRVENPNKHYWPNLT
jgi:hypothetical protein